ncbi:MAG: DUF4126 domain-containing protein, partial [Bryobacteraceae bacterium]|nr:DUF4126 domain-containing protein [Bryobacteraceae bacterium]
GIGFLAGIRLYATVFVLGLLIRFRVIELGDQFQTMLHLGSTPVLIAAGALTVVEFVSDKIAWFDSLWDSIHTFVRPIGAAALAITSLGALDPGERTAIALLTGTVALSSHAAKAATRVAVNHSPEPVSNIFVSVAEDLFLPLGLWLTMHYPLIVLGIVAAFLVALIWSIRKVMKFVRMRLQRA